MHKLADVIRVASKYVFDGVHSEYGDVFLVDRETESIVTKACPWLKEDVIDTSKSSLD